LASIAADLVGPFQAVLGMPMGGILFADALRLHVHVPVEGQPLTGDLVMLLVDDVLTTGRSLEQMRERIGSLYPGYTMRGVVAFARGPCPDWVTPLWRFGGTA